MNQIITLNNDKFLIWKGDQKIVLFTLPELKVLHKYYIDVKNISCGNDGNLLVIAQNSVCFLKIKISPLRLIQKQIQFLDWTPIGGIYLDHLVALYDSHDIIFYEYRQAFTKSWVISLLQEILEVRSSTNHKYLGVKVKETTSIIYLWNLLDVNSKPNQQIIVTDPIIQWQFPEQDMLVIMTTCQFRVYCQNYQINQLSLQYCIGIDSPIVFCWISSFMKVDQHHSRKTVRTIAVQNAEKQVHFFELYDVKRRCKSSTFNYLRNVQPIIRAKQIKHLITGWALQDRVLLVGQGAKSKPFCYQLIKDPQNPLSKFTIVNQFNFKKELSEKPQRIQYCDGFIAVFKLPQTRQQIKSCQKNQNVYIVTFYELIGSSSYQLIKEDFYQDGILGANAIFYQFFDDRIIVQNILNNEKIIINGQKIPKNIKYLGTQGESAFFISEIKLYMVNRQEKKFQSCGFSIKNPKAKLKEVNIYTKSLVYLMNGQNILIIYNIEDQKISARTVKSSSNKLVSLRNMKYLELTENQIRIGLQQKILATFNVLKWYNNILHDSLLCQYQVYWTTHHGIVLVIKNYVFLLQLISNAEGNNLVLIKKGHSFLHKRFSPHETLQLLEPRKLIFRNGNKILKLGNLLGEKISEDPYNVPQTIVRKQLDMKKFLPPHHPKIIEHLLCCGKFQLAEQIIRQVYYTIQQGQHCTLAKIYNSIGKQFFQKYSNKYDIKDQAEDENFIVKTQKITDIGLLKKISQLILQQPTRILLDETGPLILQNLIQMLIFRAQNLRSLDFYSSVILTQIKAVKYKSLPFNTRHVAFLMHSINKQQAIQFLKQGQQRIKWDWLKKYSIPLWFSNSQVIKKWLEEIAANQFRRQKEPFDCLFWYILLNKKAIVANLFKANQHSSKEHQSMVAFLQRDFTQAVNRTAAIKNAFVLMDKKRYYHALSFFVLGQKYDECVSLCLKRLNDISLAMAICVLLNLDKSKIVEHLREYGDTWAKHIAFVLESKHIDSFNCLFQQQEERKSLELVLQNTNFHPSIYQFAEQIQNSVSIKRQVQEQETQITNKNQNIFDSFYPSDSQTHQSFLAPEKIKNELRPNYQSIQAKCLTYYLQNDMSCLALTIDPRSKQAQRAYLLEQYMVTGKVTPSVEQIASDMEDIISLIKNHMQQQNPSKCLQIIDRFISELKNQLSGINLTQIYSFSKPQIGSIIYYVHTAQKIIAIHSQNEKCNQQMKNELKQLAYMGRLLISLQLNCYFQIKDNYQKKFIDNFQFSSQEFWNKIKTAYNLLPVHTKSKHHKIMDVFQPVFYQFAKRQKQTEQSMMLSSDKISSQSNVYLALNTIFLKNLLKFKSKYSTNIVQKLFEKLQKIAQSWAQEDMNKNIIRQFNSICREGSSSRSKLNYVINTLQNQYQSIQALFIVLKPIKQKLKIFDCNPKQVQNQNKNHECEAVEIYRNKQQHMKHFTLNRNEGEGMEILIGGKKFLKKFQVIESLALRNRHQDGYSLLQDQSNYQSQKINIRQIIQKQHNNLMIQNKINSIVANRRGYDGIGVIKNSIRRISHEHVKNMNLSQTIEGGDIYSLESHYYLPLFLIGGKGYFDIANFNNLKAFTRLQCPQLNEINKIWSLQNRISCMDSSGSFASYSLDSKFTHNCAYYLKKASIVDFCPITPSILATISSNVVEVYDTLLSPGKQSQFKISLSSAHPPLQIKPLKDKKIAILKKHEVQIYDIRANMLLQSYDIEGEGKSLVTNYNNKIIIGRSDSKIKMIDCSDKSTNYIKISSLSKHQDKKHSVDSISVMGKCMFFNVQNSIYFIDNL